VGHRFNFEYVPFNRDDISELSTEDLQKHIVKFKRMIKEARSLGQSTTKFEVEFCYLDHERQMRLRSEKIVRQHRRGDRKHGV